MGKETTANQWTRHHTLYEKAAFNEVGSPAHRWRGNVTMIITLPNWAHWRVHDKVPPLKTAPSEELAVRALAFCLSNYRERPSKIQGFAGVRDEMFRIAQEETLENEIGREALNLCNFFTSQLNVMLQVPILRHNYNLPAKDTLPIAE